MGTAALLSTKKNKSAARRAGERMEKDQFGFVHSAANATKKSDYFPGMPGVDAITGATISKESAAKAKARRAKKK